MIIVASKPGELGNRLFVFANFIAGVLDYKFKLANPAFDEYAKYFPQTNQDLFCRYPARRSFLKPSASLRKLLYKTTYVIGRVLAKSGIKSKRLQTITLDWDDVCELSGPNFESLLRSPQLIFMQGWKFRSQDGLIRHAAPIREFFEPLPEHRANVTRVMEQARHDTDVLVGVHIRDGIKNFANVRHFWNPPEKYAEMISQVQDFFPGKRVTFLICSDVKQDPEVFSRYRFFNGPGHLVEDLYALAECDYMFGPPSTFTLWASYIGEVPLKFVLDSSQPLRLDEFVLTGAGDNDPLKFDPHAKTAAAASDSTQFAL
ncbi:MAG: hypothetical protein QOD75_688 [Blastocatellia bacterium]|jgi:hypothetical protein|nr:hypothetical protein [Blastocatellia bacterium]